MDIEQIVADFRSEMRSLAWQGELLEALPYVTRRSDSSGEQNFVTAFELDENSADDAIEAEISYFAGLGRDFEWKVFSFDSPCLLERLGSAGFKIGEREAVVIYDVSEGIGPFEGAFECEVRKVVDETGLDDFRSVAEAVFKKDYSFTVAQLGNAILTGQPGHDGYVAYVSSKPVSIGRLYTDPKSLFAGFYGGGTLSQHRGRGYYRAVVVARALDAMKNGARYLQVDAMPTSLPILRKLGFVHVADTWPCTYLP